MAGVSSFTFSVWAAAGLSLLLGVAGMTLAILLGILGVFSIVTPGVVPSLPTVAWGAHVSTSISELDFGGSLLTIIISLLERSRLASFTGCWEETAAHSEGSPRGLLRHW